MYLTIRGLVLRIVDYKDHDALLTLLTPDHGRMTVKVRGIRRKNCPHTAACQLLTLSEFTLFEYRDMYTVNEAHSIELFHGLRRDLQKLSLGTYFAQVAEVISQEDIPSPQLLSLVLNSLHVLSDSEISELKVKSVFEFRCACLAGYFPDLSGCNQCSNPGPDRFDVSSGMLECGTCRNPHSQGIRMPVSPSMLDAMRYIADCDPKRLFSFHIPESDMESLSHLTEVYLSTQLERGFSTLDFYKSLFVV